MFSRNCRWLSGFHDNSKWNHEKTFARSIQDYARFKSLFDNYVSGELSNLKLSLFESEAETWRPFCLEFHTFFRSWTSFSICFDVSPGETENFYFLRFSKNKHHSTSLARFSETAFARFASALFTGVVVATSSYRINFINFDTLSGICPKLTLNLLFFDS